MAEEQRWLEDEERLDEDYCNIMGSSAAVTGFLQGNRIVNLKRRVRDVQRNTSKTFSCPYMVTDQEIKPLLAPVEVEKRVLDCTSASGLVNVKINDISSTSTNENEKKCVIEITRDISLEKVVDVSSVHGKVMGDGWFGTSGCNHFSNDEKYFVYVAGWFICDASLFELVSYMSNLFICSAQGQEDYFVL